MLCVGNQTSCWTANLGEPFEYALARGFKAFEWFPDKKPGAGWDESDLDATTRESIRERARRAGMVLSVHARWQANPLLPDGATVLWRDLELARELRAVLLNIHLMDDQGPEAFLKAIQPLIKRTREAKVKLSIENTPEHSPEQFNELFARLQEQDSADSRHVGMCLDLGHANLCAATRNDYLAFCDRLAPHVPIIHLHLHENWGDSDSHLPLFTGPAGRSDLGIRGLIERLKTRNYSGAAILEQWPHPPELLDQARGRLLELWGGNGETKEAPADSHKPARSEPPRVEITSADFVGELASADRAARSWREKLQVVLNVLADGQRKLGEDELAYISIYLRFLGTGEIACVEDGRHFRPGNHARLASEIQERLASLVNPENEFLVRRIYPWLPSTSSTFQRAEPLTRIRDIAHRNDIDQELKREIKTTLQNKLHRCAGPEDLVTASALLQRITAPGAHYSADFVQQFKIFHTELAEFFNAQSLEERLSAVRSKADPELQHLIERFLKEKVGKSSEERLGSLRCLTRLRRLFREKVRTLAGSERQELLLADVALEDFAFVLLSEIINLLAPLPSPQAWRPEIDALIFALENLELSGFDPPETQVLQHELHEWGGSLGLQDELLRLHASVLRSRRFAENFSERIITLFAQRATKLGRLLGVADHAIRVFSESDLRGHLVFQTSKLTSALLRRIRETLRLPPWDVLVGGRALGRVLSLDSLEDIRHSPAGDKDVLPAADFAREDELTVVLLKNAAGDEEIPRNVSAIVLGHELPHLSHLGIRARQAGVVFVTCEGREELERLQRLQGKTIALLALPKTVSWEETDRAAPLSTEPARASFKIPKLQVSPESPWISLERATPENSGGKASGARRLAEMSHRDETRFLTPRSLVVPFGVMEGALAAQPKAEREYHELVGSLTSASSAELPRLARKLRDLVQELAVPDAVTREVGNCFPAKTSLIVRSSANCEDLEELAGAGLYDSIINVTPARVASAIRAVWSSLWTERATASRQSTGIPHSEAHMAVLIQELLAPDLSFVLHTVNPVSLNEREVYIEIVVGLGETLASAALRGNPYRLVADKDSGEVVTVEFANFSWAAQPAAGGGVRRDIVDYSQVELSREAASREGLGRRLASIGSFVERTLRQAQDIEGAVVGDRVYLVQARPQTGLKARSSR